MCYTENIESLQIAITKFIGIEGEVTYSRLKNVVLVFAQKYNFELSDDRKSKIFYDSVFPLVRLGLIEYGVSNGKTIFYLPIKRNDSSLEKAYKDGLSLICGLPSVSKYVESLPIERNPIQFNYYSSNGYNWIRAGNKVVGFYKQDIRPFYYSFLLDRNSEFHRIEKRERSFEAFDYALTYANLYGNDKHKKELYLFSHDNKEITFNKLAFIPPFVVRALCLIDYENYGNLESYGNDSICFHNVDDKIIKELTRIF